MTVVLRTQSDGHNRNIGTLKFKAANNRAQIDTALSLGNYFGHSERKEHSGPRCGPCCWHIS